MNSCCRQPYGEFLQYLLVFYFCVYSLDIHYCLMKTNYSAAVTYKNLHNIENHFVIVNITIVGSYQKHIYSNLKTHWLHDTPHTQICRTDILIMTIWHFNFFLRCQQVQNYMYTPLCLNFLRWKLNLISVILSLSERIPFV